MCNEISYFTIFLRSQTIPELPNNHISIDFGENLHQFGLLVLAIGLNRVVEVEKIQDDYKFRKINQSLIRRIAALALAILFFPVTATCILVGSISKYFSKTYFELQTELIKQRRLSSQKRTSPYIKPHLETLPQASPLVIQQFQVPRIDFQKAEGQQILKDVIKTIEKKPDIKPLIDFYIRLTNENPVNNICNELNQGTCYGQRCAIFETVQQLNSYQITPETLAQHLIPQKYVYYQIMHHLHAYFTSLDKQGHDESEPLRVLQQELPFSEQEIQTKAFTFTQQKDIEDWLAKSLQKIADSSKDHSSQKSYIVDILFLHPNKKHIVVIYYNQNEQMYYWHDANTGLLCTQDQKAFINICLNTMLSYHQLAFEKINFTIHQVEKK